MASRAVARSDRCIDCPPDAPRRSTVRKPGPRCSTHQRARRIRNKASAWERHIWVTYKLKPEDYEKILDLQGGLCYICQRASGKTKKLSVDHDHKTGEVRGLLCTPCNRGVLGHLRDDPEACRRAADYLENPPATAILLPRRAA